MFSPAPANAKGSPAAISLAKRRRGTKFVAELLLPWNSFGNVDSSEISFPPQVEDKP
jgi:hypothetical protein